MPDFKLINAQLAALLANETNLIANLANASALLNDSVDQLNWTGFYLYDPKGDELVLGPFQGHPACMHIAMNKGVCGQAAAQKVGGQAVLGRQSPRATPRFTKRHG